jgi:hypothetical protein
MEQYFAQLNDQNIVIALHVVTAEFMAANPERYTGVWVETFTDNPNKNYAGIGYTYNFETQDFFVPYVEPLPLPAAEP